MAWMLWPLGRLAEARGLLFPWIPVFVGIGIWIWLALPFEPGWPSYATAAGIGILALASYRFGPELTHPMAVIVGAVVVGLLAAGGRAHWVAAPMLDFRYYGPVQGRVTEIDRAQSDALRVTLDQVVLLDVPPNRTPRHVRISVQDASYHPEPGQVILLTGFLAAPEGPAEPGGFDFRRMAFFNQLGAVGYSRSPVMIWQDPAPGEARINRLRRWLAAQMMAAMPGDAGAFAAGAMTGDRSGIHQDTVLALRASNLAHLLAISGMNMAFLTGFVFMFLRYGIALFPPVALRVDARKVAAVVAFAVALFYLLLSGSNVATERAFLMVSVMLGAVVLDRRALTLRSVALAALVLLLAKPESLAEPGFQLSFAATVVLIAGFEALDRQILRERLPRWTMPLFTLVLTSVLAGAATAPYAAATFNRFTDYGLLANLLTVPVMSVLMAAGAMVALLAPIGLAAPAYWVMELAARWILFVAHWVADLDGAITPIVVPMPVVIPMLTLSGIWLVLWRGIWRFAALAPMAVALALWAVSPRPLGLISSEGNLIGVMGPEGRVLSVANASGFAAESWLQDDGDLATPADAAARAGFSGPKSAREFRLGDWRGVVLKGKSAASDLAPACARYDLVVLAAAVAPPDPRPQGCLLIDRAMLSRTGSIALSLDQEAIILHPARRAQRIWLGPEPVLTRLRYVRPAARTAGQ